MLHVRTATVARIGRSYPRSFPGVPAAGQTLRRRLRTPVGVTAAVVALLSALGLLGWFLSR